jgi:argininosuccinate lyase
VSVDLRLYLRRRIPLLQHALCGVIGAFADQAERGGDALMPSYTHLRRAMPVLVAHYFLSHAAALRRDHDRLAQAREEANALPLGSGAIAGTGYAIDTAALAARLGFDRVVANSMDTSSDRDFAATFLYAATLAMVHLSRIAEDMILFTSEEFGFFELADSSATGSSMMPQKKNPDPLELVRGKTGRAIGRSTGWLVTMKGLPTGYNKDLQEDKEAVFESEYTLAVSLRAAHAVVSKLTVNSERSGRAASGLLLATDVADYLATHGMPFRRAHEVVGKMVRSLLAQGRDFSDLTLE